MTVSKFLKCRKSSNVNRLYYVCTVCARRSHVCASPPRRGTPRRDLPPSRDFKVLPMAMVCEIFEQCSDEYPRGLGKGLPGKP